MKLLIVGLGSMGKRRARLSKGIDAALHIVGVDTAEARRAEACTLGLADAAYPTIAEAVAAEHPDAALVCTAPLSHAAVIGELLDNDLPVFTELNLVGDGYAENMAKAAAKNLPLFLSSTMLYRRETQYIKQQVQAFGKPVHYIYHIGQYLPDWHPWENYKNFFVGNARTGGVREIFGIDLPWLLDAFGDVESVTVQKDTISDLGLPYPDCVTLLLRHKGGVQGVLAADVVSRKAVRSFECFGDGIHLFWEGNPKALYEFKDGDKQPVNTYASFEHDSRYSDNIVENAFAKAQEREDLQIIFSVCEARRNPWFNMFKIVGDHAEMVIESQFTGRQQAPEVYDVNASIYVIRRAFLVDNPDPILWHSKFGVSVMMDTGIIDIDSEHDYLLMEAIAKHLYAHYPEFNAVRENIRGE